MQGKVAFVNERPWQGQMLYSFKLANDEALYVCGTTKPNVVKGDFVTFEAKENKRGQMAVNMSSIVRKEGEVLSPSDGAKPQGWAKSGFNDDKRQRTIEWQAARNSAIAAAQVILSNGAIKLPAKESGKYDAVMALIADLTKQFFAETATLGEAPKVAEVQLPEVDTTETEDGDKGDEWD